MPNNSGQTGWYWPAFLSRAMLAGVLLAVLAVPLSAQPLKEDSTKDRSAAEEINQAQYVKLDTNSKTGNLEMKAQELNESDRGVVSEERDGKKYFHQKGFGAHYYNFHQPYSSPPVKFVSNGHPYNIVVNPREYLASTTEPTSTVSTPAHTDSPLIWLTNTFFFNGRPTSVFSLPQSPWRPWPPVHRIPPSILQG